MRTRAGVIGLLCVGILATACGPAAPTPTPPARQTALRLDTPGDPDVVDVPWLMMIDALREQGYAIETTAFDDIALPIVALGRGDLDAASLSNLGAWAAIADGAPIVTIMDVSAVTLAVVAPTEFEECADLDGKNVAVGGLSGVSSKMVQDYFEQRCPGAHPNFLVISGSSNRRAGLLAGELDAALLPVDDLLRLQGQGQAGFHSLVSLSQEFPGLTISSFVARRSLAEAYPETVKDVIRASLVVRRSIQDPQVLSEQIVKYLELDPDTARGLAELFLANRVWDVNGGYTPETVQANIDFLIGTGDLPADMKAEDVADLSYLDAVLAEIGRQ